MAQIVRPQSAGANKAAGVNSLFIDGNYDPVRQAEPDIGAAA
jgi:hypothetical protein